MRNFHTKQGTVTSSKKEKKEKKKKARHGQRLEWSFRRKEVEPVAVFRALGTTSLATGSSTTTSFLFPGSIESSSFILCDTLRRN